MRKVAAVPDHPEHGVLEFLLPGTRRLSHGVDIRRIDVGVANDPDRFDGLEFFRRQREQAGLKIAGDPVVTQCVREALAQKRIKQAMSPRAEALDSHDGSGGGIRKVRHIRKKIAHKQEIQQVATPEGG